MVTFGSRLFSLVGAALLFGLAAPAWSQEVFHGNDNNNKDPRQQSGLQGPGDDNGLFLRRPHGLHFCPRDHGYYRDSRTCGRLEAQDLQPPPAMADDASLVSTCGTILQQNGNFRNSISCKSGRVTGFCEQYGASDPECPAIMAQLRREVPNLGGLTYDGSRSVSPCQHNPRSTGCRGETRPTSHPPYYGAKNLSRTPLGQISPDQPATLPIGLENIAQGIDACFKRYLPEYKSPDWKLYSEEALDPLSDRVFERAFQAAYDSSLQALKAVGPLSRGHARQENLDYLTGWVTGCLGEREILPMQGAQIAYQRWVRAVYPSATDEEKSEHEQDFRIGYTSRDYRPFGE